MNRTLTGILLWLALLATAAAATTTSEEIAHLLNFVATSDCSFERNGTRYDGQEARDHIQRKYDYIRDRVTSAEEFIRYAASESSFSGRPYHATCDGRTITSREWLSRELERFRQSRDQGSPVATPPADSPR